MGQNSTKKLRRLPMQPAGFPMGTHDPKRTIENPCRCGACATGVKVNLSAKIGNKAVAQESSKGKK